MWHRAHSPKVLTLAAAEHTDQEGDNDNSAEHCQGDYQRLEVHCRQAQGRLSYSGSSQRQVYRQAHSSWCVEQMVIFLWPAEDTRPASTSHHSISPSVTMQLLFMVFVCDDISAGLTHNRQQQEEVVLNGRAAGTRQATTVSPFPCIFKACQRFFITLKMFRTYYETAILKL